MSDQPTHNLGILGQPRGHGRFDLKKNINIFFFDGFPYQEAHFIEGGATRPHTQGPRIPFVDRLEQFLLQLEPMELDPPE